MDGNGLPIIGPSVDKTKIEPIHQKRLIAFINHFLTTTVSFLNTFSHSVETRLEKCEGQLQKMDAALCILEAKLNSIAGLEDVPVATPENPPEFTPPPPPVAPVTDVPSSASEPQPNNATPAQTKISQDPQYSRFFRMVAVGVPLQAVKQKMHAEGLDPGILDDPDAPAPTNTSLGGVSVADEKPEDSDSSFSN